MRHEFMELFRDTRLHPPGEAPAGQSGGEAASRPRQDRNPRRRPPPEPSRFLRRFLQHAAPSPEPAPSGLAALDDRLGGGFGQGLHLVIGGRRRGKDGLSGVAGLGSGGKPPSLPLLRSQARQP